MFTGLVEEMGSVLRLEQRGDLCRLWVAAQVVLSDVKLGDSISVNGVCLTVTEFDGGRFAADVMPQTLRHSNLGELRPKALVNLERALMVGGRFGGHMVSGHIDGMVTLRSVRREGNALWYTFRADSSLMPYLVPRGSVALDGISLTVAAVEREGFSVSLIPHTLEQTALKAKGPGAKINMECDLVGKHIVQQLNRQAFWRDYGNRME